MNIFSSSIIPIPSLFILILSYLFSQLVASFKDDLKLHELEDIKEKATEFMHTMTNYRKEVIAHGEKENAQLQARRATEEEMKERDKCRQRVIDDVDDLRENLSDLLYAVEKNINAAEEKSVDNVRNRNVGGGFFGSLLGRPTVPSAQFSANTMTDSSDDMFGL